MTILVRARIIKGTLTTGKFNQEKNKTEYGVTCLIRDEAKTKICDIISNEINILEEFNSTEKAELFANLNNKFKKSNNFDSDNFDTVVSFYTQFPVAGDFSVDTDVDDVQSGDTVIIRFVTKFGKTKVFGKNLCYIKMYPNAVKLEQHGKSLIDPFSGMSEEEVL